MTARRRERTFDLLGAGIATLALGALTWGLTVLSRPRPSVGPLVVAAGFALTARVVLAAAGAAALAMPRPSGIETQRH